MENYSDNVKEYFPIHPIKNIPFLIGPSNAGDAFGGLPPPRSCSVQFQISNKLILFEITVALNKKDMSLFYPLTPAPIKC